MGPSMFINVDLNSEGCPKISQKWLVDTKKDVIYPKGSLSLDPFRAPVQRLPESSEYAWAVEFVVIYCRMISYSNAGRSPLILKLENCDFLQLDNLWKSETALMK